MNDVLQELVTLYRRYRLSKPSGTKEDKSKWFVADCMDDLSNEALMFGESRPDARKALEAFFCGAIKEERLTWQWGKMWFKDFADMGEPRLVLRREWFEMPTA